MQNKDCKKNMLCKVSVSNSLCSSRTVKSIVNFKAIFGHAIELSSKYFTQIHCYLFMPLGENNNAAKFIVSLKQNNSEGFLGAP